MGAAIALLAASAALAQPAPAPETGVLPPPAPSGEPFNIKGMISAREGSKMTVTTPDGAHTVVTITDSTRVVSSAGKLGLQKSDKTHEELITGLPVSVDAVRNGAEIDASKVTFKSGDLKTARQIEAGTAQAKERARAKATELQAQNDELRKRMSEANQYVEKAQTTVLFATGSAQLSAQAKADLQSIANRAKAIKGYFISAVGYADVTGNAEANQKLSERRAAAVIAYLQKYCGVMAQRVLAGDAMGDAHQISNDHSASGLAQNRRVVVKVLTNKGLEGL
jgi:outer membrane protein OmpA-like peptidoglycan-associated protein